MSKFFVISLFFVVFGLISAKYAKPNSRPRWAHLEGVKNTHRADEETQAVTVTEMIQRLIPGQEVNFNVTVDETLVLDGKDVFEIRNNPDGVRIDIIGSSGVAAAWGFQYYAKIYGGCLFSWSGNQVSSMPSVPPRVGSSIKVVANDLFRYYQNVCSTSYSYVWWNWTRWEQEIDWMALNGINLPLAFNGQEEIFRRVYLNLGFEQKDLDAFFTGPAFFAWGRMGNIDGWGGPLLESFYTDQITLQKQILQRMREFGMTPVLPAFSGHVPATIQNYYPEVNVTRLDDWGNFNSTYCCTYLLDPSDPLFQTIGRNFIQEMEAEFGVDHVYNCDTFNEMTPPSSDPEYFNVAGNATYSALIAGDPDAVWLMQGWLFLNAFWTPELVESYVLSVPIGRMLILDLFSENEPLYQNFESYYGQPWIWCMLQNFGGVKGLYGTVSRVNNGPFQGRAFPNTTMVGTGLTMEGIEINDIMYELMNEMGFLRIPTNLNSWFTDWAQRRYGVNDVDAAAAWITLSESALNCSSTGGFHGQFVVTQRPNFNINYYYCYNVSNFVPAWDSIVKASLSPSLADADLFHHDLIDISREALTIVATKFYQGMQNARNTSTVSEFTQWSDQFLNVLTDLDTLLATDRRFLLGPWIESAKSWAASPEEKGSYEYNARNQITLWGPTGNELDYATKQWSGIVNDYYKPRWQLFVDEVTEAIAEGKSFNITEFTRDVFNQVETPFTYNTDLYSTETAGDPIAVAQQMHTKWRAQLDKIELEDENIIKIDKSYLSGKRFDESCMIEDK